MNAPETINIEKYAEALNNLVGMDIGYLGDSDKNVNAIIEVIVTAKKLENRVKELTEEIKDLEADYDRVYEQAEADIHGNMADGGTSCHWCMEKTKADTAKRMSEMLKEYLDDFYNSGEDALLDVPDLIDQIAEEILEEKNG